MKHNLLVFLFILLLIPTAQGQAQNEISAIDSLSIELWPDYDRSSVLVLLTGVLPADTLFPATVIVPLPENAQLNAVARIDIRDGIMKDDIASVPGPSDMLMFITPDLQFRVEYYIPYIVKGSQRLLDYSWLADIDVNNLQLKIQQPKSATFFNVKPLAVNIKTESDGLTYHAFPPKVVLAGQSFSFHLEYEMTTAQLSINSLLIKGAENQGLGETFPSAIDSPIDSLGNWAILPIILGGLMIIIGLVWMIASRRNQMDTHEINSQNPQKKTRAKFCRDCGEPVDETDKWCDQCGAFLA